jgi:hypothetical protein
MAAVTLNLERQPAAASRVDVALRSIQEAQELIEQATHLLSAVAGMHSGCKRLGCLSSQLTWAWFAVAATANRRRRRPSSALPEQ